MNLEKMPINEMIMLFVSISEQQYPHTLNGDIQYINRLIYKLENIDKELRRRGPEARLELTKLFNHPNIQVRRNAATRSLGVALKPAMDVLRQITKEDFGPFRLDAGMTIALVEDGTVIPT